MNRNDYDTDVTTFHPSGRLFQVEYAIEAVKQGSVCVGLVSKDYAVLATLKRSASELASYQQKIFKIDEHIGVAVSGLIPDARVLAKYMRDECLNHRWAYETPVQTNRLVQMISDKAQVFTQKNEKRPYGVGFLIIGYDKTGPHLYETRPSGQSFDYRAQAIGARCQSSKTYLEKFFESFPDLAIDDLVRHALKAVKGAAPTGITSQNVSVAYVGKDTHYTILENDTIKQFVQEVNAEDEEKVEEKATVMSE